MRLLFDHNVPRPLRRLLPDYEIEAADERGWNRLTNGDLLNSAEAAGFGLLATADKNLGSQQNLDTRKISIGVLPIQNMDVLRVGVASIAAAIERAGTGGCQEISLPRQALRRRPPPPHIS